jgi:hypothetical protein
VRSRPLSLACRAAVLTAAVAAPLFGLGPCPDVVAPAAGEEPRPAVAAEPPVSAFRFRSDDRVRRNVDLARIAKGLPVPDPRDGIPAIENTVIVSAAEVDFLADDDPVIGVALGGEARAYAIRVLDRHEIANDRLGDVSVAVTYCPLCDSGVAFLRRFDWDAARTDEPPLTFRCSGYLYDSDVLIYDRQTETFWHQFTGGAAVGPLTGSSLETVPAVRTTWKAWRAEHPGTTALSWRTEHGFRRELYAVSPYATYRASKQFGPFPVSRQDPRLPRKSTVYGLSSGSEHLAIPWDAVAGRTEPIAVALGGRRFRVAVDPSGGTLRAQVEAEPRGPAASGGATGWAEAPILRCYWFAWYAFHPTTAVWAPPAGGAK